MTRLRPDAWPLGCAIRSLPRAADAGRRPARPACDRPDGYTDIVAGELNDTEQWSLGALSIVNRRAELLPFDPSFDSARPLRVHPQCLAAAPRYKVKTEKSRTMSPPKSASSRGSAA